MRVECWMLEVTDIHSEYVLLIAFSLQHGLLEGVSVLYFHLLSYYCKANSFKPTGAKQSNLHGCTCGFRTTITADESSHF
jgi:hypothetical protein